MTSNSYHSLSASAKNEADENCRNNNRLGFFLSPDRSTQCHLHILHQPKSAIHICKVLPAEVLCSLPKCSSSCDKGTLRRKSHKFSPASNSSRQLDQHLKLVKSFILLSKAFLAEVPCNLPKRLFRSDRHLWFDKFLTAETDWNVLQWHLYRQLSHLYTYVEFFEQIFLAVPQRCIQVR